MLPARRVLRNRILLIAIPAAALLLTGLAVVRWRALRAFQESARALSEEQNLGVTVRELSASRGSRFEWIASPMVFTAATQFRGHLYLCGPSGLEEYDSRGTLERRFHVGTELPPSPLLRMAVGVLADSREPELLLATAREGLLAFNGARFRQIYPADADVRQITSILPLGSGRLLFGTEKRGVLVYDGKQVSPLHPTLAGFHVTELAGSESDLWVGTLDRGVLHWHAGQTDAYAEAQGMPDPQVLSLLVDGDRTLVGTPLGVAEFERGRLARVLAGSAFAQSLAVTGTTLLIGTMDQGIIRVPLEAGTSRAGLPPPGAAASVGEVRQIFNSEGAVYALARTGLYALDNRGFGWKPVLESPDAPLADRNVSALAVQPDQKLWVGFFDRGLDILEPDARRARHVEDEHVFCVNRVVRGPGDQTIAVATANGLVLFDHAGNQKQVLGRTDGLISDHITDVAVEPDRLVVATPAGITFLDPDGPRSLYAFEGLVNNHVYALGVSGRQLLAGTLGGLSLLEKERVVTNYTTGNSGLHRNWISALVPLGRDWMVGTYGGGIVRLDDSGHFHAYDLATGSFEINPNAMLVTERHVFAGSLGHGLFVYDRATDRWRNFREGLPSENVTAVAAGNGYLYVGTDNGLIRIREQELAP
jgi:ligand-binding sensor domain-containing protein